MSSHIFVSHSHQDNPFCRALVEALRNAGADAWYDEHNLGPGHLMREIQAELQARPIFIVILSPAALASTWVEDETTWFYSLYRAEPHRVIVPVLAAPIQPDDIWLFLRGFKRIEAGHEQPYPQAEAIRRTALAVGLTPKEDDPMSQHYRETLATYDQILAINPQDVDAWFLKAAIYHEMGEYERSVDAWEHHLALAPNTALGWWNKGCVLLDLGRNDEALLDFERSIALDPTPPIIWGNKALALMGLSRYSEALQAMEQALSRDPHYEYALAGRVDVLIKLGRPEEALAAANQWVALEPQNVAALFKKAEALKALKR